MRLRQVIPWKAKEVWDKNLLKNIQRLNERRTISMDLLIESISMFIIRFSILLKSTIWFLWQLANESWFILFFQFDSTNHTFDVNITVFSACSAIVCHRWQKKMAQIYYMATISMPPTIFAKFFLFLDAYNSILLRFFFGWLSLFCSKSIFSLLSFVFINMYSHGCWNYGKVNVISRDIEKSGTKQWMWSEKKSSSAIVVLFLPPPRTLVL